MGMKAVAGDDRMMAPQSELDMVLKQCYLSCGNRLTVMSRF